MKRRSLLQVAAGLLLAPAVVRAESLMPIVPLTPQADRIESMWRRGQTISGVWRPERSLNMLPPLSGLGGRIENADIRFANDVDIFVKFDLKAEGWMDAVHFSNGHSGMGLRARMFLIPQTLDPWQK